MMKFRIKSWRKRKGKSKKQRRTSIEDLPRDISLNIFKRLPVKSLFSVKSVCKAFYDLASHPELILHCHHLQKNPYGLIIRSINSSYVNELYYTNQLYLVDSRRCLAKIIQPRMNPKEYDPGPLLSSNGLVCLLYYKNKVLPPLRQYRACLVNPLTGEYKFLVDPGLPKVQDQSSHNGTIVLSDQYFGFGFDAITHEYKLVRIVRICSKDVRTYLQVEVFTLGKNGCRIHEIDTPFVCPHQSSDVVVGGAIHWLCKDENSPGYDRRSRIILSFDFLEEKFHQIPKPNCEVCEFGKLSVLGDRLAITGGFKETCRTYEVHIWVLKEYGVEESWHREFVIGQGSRRLYPLFLLNNGEIVMSCESKAICCYNPQGDFFSNSAELDRSFVAICHACSLVSPFDL